MPALISDAQATSIRSALSAFLTHTATITPKTAGAANDWGEDTATDGTPVTGVACKYKAEDRVVIDESGRTLVSVPTITLAHDQTIAVGSSVSNVTASDGTVLLVGPVTVEYVTPSAGLGPVLRKKAVLHGGDTQ